MATSTPLIRVIETGTRHFTHPNYPYQAGSKESLTAKGFPVDEIVETDTLLTLKQVHEELRAILNPILIEGYSQRDHDYDWNMEYFGPSFIPGSIKRRDDEKWPEDADIAVYPSRGGSEGWIVNVAATTRQKDGSMKHDVILWGKMFGGKETVWQTVRLISDALGNI